MEPDFSGWATKSGLVCSDGRVITDSAFTEFNGKTIPLVWQHKRDTPGNVLGHALIEAKEGGYRCHAFFNKNPEAQKAKELVHHGDIKSLSIYANELVQKGRQVMHGNLIEVSLVLRGANPGALIDNVTIRHSDGEIETLEHEAIIYTDLPLEVNEDLDEESESDEGEEMSGTVQHADGEKTVKDVFDTLTEEQKNVVMFMIGEALENGGDAEHDSEDDDEEVIEHDQEGSNVTRNIFEGNGDAVTHVSNKHLTPEQITALIHDADSMGSFKKSFLAHADEYGITNIEVLFPDAQAIDNKPEWITRRMEWVEKVLNGTRKLPFSKIKSLSADLTHEEARAKGYIKGDMKKEQFFEIAKRETGPKTIYKKHKLDRDDIIDITDFDVVAWIWVEMRFILREEIARAILVGDGREVDDPDKIDENKIRPIAHDDPFYTDVIVVPTNASGDEFVEAVIRGRETYHGSGNPTAFMTRSVLNDMLLLKDKMGRRLYRNRSELAAELEVSEIIDVEILNGQRTDDGDIIMIMVNLSDYCVGATRGGEITTFDDFDIDFNQYKYLIEGRMSGALTKYKTAQVVVRASGTRANPTVPGFVPATGVVTIPTVVGVVYKNQDSGATLAAGAQAALAPGASVSVVATPAVGYYFDHNLDADWTYTRPIA